MFCRSLLLILLVLACFQSFSAAKDRNKPDKCCFSHQQTKIHVKYVKSYEKTWFDCPKPGAIFKLNTDQEVCVDTRLDWVKSIMEKLDQRQ